MVPYVVGTVFAVTVMHILFCVACVYATRMLRCEGDDDAGVWSGEVCSFTISSITSVSERKA